jgi:hypothetical protein
LKKVRVNETTDLRESNKDASRNKFKPHSSDNEKQIGTQIEDLLVFIDEILH